MLPLALANKIRSLIGLEPRPCDTILAGSAESVTAAQASSTEPLQIEGWSFRIRFQLGARTHLSIEEPIRTLADDGRERVALTSLDQETPISKAQWLCVRGTRYDSESEAEEAARRWRGYIQVGLARLAVGTDFGDRSPLGGYTAAALKEMSNAAGRLFVNDNQQAILFEGPNAPIGAFVGPIYAEVGKPGDRALEAIRAAKARDLSLTDQQRLASDLYCSSFSLDTPDARLVTLMNALEAMLDPLPRAPEVQEHVARLIQLTAEAELSSAEKSSIHGTLKWLYVQSINQAGRKLVSQLEGRTYYNESPSKFFTNTYSIRSRIVHGAVQRPARDEVSIRAAELEQLVGHLLSRELLTVFDF